MSHIRRALVMRVSEAIQQYKDYLQFGVGKKTSERQLSDISQLCVFLRDPEIHNITPEDISSLFKLLERLGWSHMGIRKKAIMYRQFFKYMNNRHYPVFDYRLIPLPPKIYTQPRIAHESEYKKLLSIIPSKGFSHVRNAAYIRMLWDTGARSGELASLDLVDLKHKRAVVRTEKSRGQKPFREIFWTDDTQKYLDRWLEFRYDYASKYSIESPEAVFISRPSSGRHGVRVNSHTVSICLRKYSKMANLPCMNAHSFRHRKAHDIIHKGGTQADVMNILGHAKLESSNIYVQMNDRELADRARKFLN